MVDAVVGLFLALLVGVGIAAVQYLNQAARNTRLNGKTILGVRVVAPSAEERWRDAIPPEAAIEVAREEALRRGWGWPEMGLPVRRHGGNYHVGTGNRDAMGFLITPDGNVSRAFGGLRRH